MGNDARSTATSRAASATAIRRRTLHLVPGGTRRLRPLLMLPALLSAICLRPRLLRMAGACEGVVARRIVRGTRLRTVLLPLALHVLRARRVRLRTLLVLRACLLARLRVAFRRARIVTLRGLRVLRAGVGDVARMVALPTAALRVVLRDFARTVTRRLRTGTALPRA